MAKPGGRPSGNGPRPGSRKPKPKSRGGGKRIPPPPDNRRRGPQFDNDGSRPAYGEDGDRSEVVERVDSAGTSKRKKKTKAKNRAVDVSHVEMRGVPAATAAKLQGRLAQAAVAFENERFTEAEQALKSIHKLAPGVPEVHELLGLTHYRMGRWVKALAELEQFNELTSSVEQHPVMADCSRALKRWARAEELWHELGEASPGPELVEEGRIVQAGVLADRGKLDDAIRFLERAPKVKGKPALHHLRRWYVLGDLYERAGDNSRARRIFADIARAEPDFGDAAERAAS
jgi:tetratricopeptide (TPR) repeat protein